MAELQNLLANATSEETRNNVEPCYFHILWDHELDDLHDLLENLLKRRAEVMERWHRLYVVHFGDSRALSETEFSTIFGSELECSIPDLLRKDMEGFTAKVRAEADELAAREIPYSEVIVSMHLFEESVATIFPSFPPALPRLYLAFDKLSHIRTIILAEAYFRSRSATAQVRIEDLEKEASRIQLDERSRFHGLVGSSAPMRRLYERVQAASRTRGTILIVGESGTGKELVARAVHEAEHTASSAPFIPFNCAAIPKDLIESELFGYRRGAFSGATAEYLGLFRAAEGGTLFLDEVTEMGAETQSKLLRAIQEHSVRPVGSTKEVPVDARLIASTNREPEEAVRSGQLRQDLYYRLEAGELRLPPLREREEDIPLLVEHFIELFNEKTGRKPPVDGIEPEALEAMRRYQWPGNVRELSNAIEAALTFGRGSKIGLQDLRSRIRGMPGPPEVTANLPGGTFADVEREVIRRALEQTEGNKVQAAKLLRISRKKLYAKITKFGL